MTWLLADAGQRAKGVPRMFATMARHHYLRDGVVEFVTDGADTAGAAMWAPPGKWKTSRLTDLRMMPGFFRAGGSHMKRGLAVDELLKENHPEEPHWYLAFIGSDPTYRGGGFGHALMTAGLARADAEHAPAYLESSNAANLGYYQRFGFEVTGELVVPDGPTLWPMWRQPR
ncbi:MAG: GNAT family N-acetyltransferase [Mycobacterium sp.]|nr:GNAT family N-acetyltransferase [Mycobacterium sp.]